jgi:hypothetical protein
MHQAAEIACGNVPQLPGPVVVRNGLRKPMDRAKLLSARRQTPPFNG